MSRSKTLQHLGFEIDVKNFGPLSSAQIKLKPLTIFAGPNNSGKSYASALVHSMSQSQIASASYDILEDYLYDSVNFPNQNLSYCIDTITKTLKQGSKHVISQDVTDKLADFCFSIIKDGLLKSISRNFGASGSDLITTGRKSSAIAMNSCGMRAVFSGKNHEIQIASQSKLEFKIVSEDMLYLHIYNNGTLEDKIALETIPKKPHYDMLVRLAIVRMFSYIFERFITNTIKNTCYLPASRSGIIAAHKTLMSGIMKSVEHTGGMDGITVPKLPGTISAFISNLMLAPSSKGVCWSIAASLENEIGGKITRTMNMGAYQAEITYLRKRKKIPLHGASSSVSELAPLVLYLKHIVCKGDLLILEEPEAHLDFEMQRILARHIAKMIRLGVNVLITTHSFFVQEQIGQCLMSARASPSLIKKLGWAKDEYLHADEVAYYLFDEDAKGGSYTVKQMEISDDGDMPMTKFDKSLEQLHDNRLLLER